MERSFGSALFPHAALACRIREEQRRGLALIKAQSAGKWRPGRGRAVGKMISFLREGAIAAILDSFYWNKEGIAVVAAGGLGRKELAPGSDADLVILHGDDAPVEAFSRGFLQALWDAGFEVTASTRTVSNCLAHAREDITFFTSLLSARLIAGDARLFSLLTSRFSKLIRPIGKRLLAFWLEETKNAVNGVLSERDISLFAKEPNVKKFPGGLRVFHLLDWVAVIRRGVWGKPELGVLCTPIEKKRIEEARDIVLALRIILHFASGGKEDTLAFDYQEAAARGFGFNGDEAEAIRAVMGLYYRKLLLTHRILFRSLESALQDLSCKTRFAVILRTGALRAVGKTVYPEAGRAVDTDSTVALLKRLSSGRKMFSAAALAFLTLYARTSADEEQVAERRMRFIGLLALDHAASWLRAAHHAGLLNIVFPILAPVKLFYVRNPVHLLPVDLHSIAAVDALERLYAGDASAASPGYVTPIREATERYRGRSWALKLALLIHDAGKGFPGDHVKNGVEAAARFLAALPITRQIREAILFLIEHHLLLSTAVRLRDTTDERVLKELISVFALSPFPEEYLDLLTVFTFADVRATNPKNCGGYFLLHLVRLYQKLRDLLSVYPESRLKMRAADARFPVDGRLGDPIAAFVQTLGTRYAERHDAEEAARDFRILSGLVPDHFMVSVEAGSECLRVLFYAWDRPGLFALLAGICARSGAAIVRADIHTYDGKAIDEFDVVRIFESDAAELTAAGDAERLEAALLRDFAVYRNDISGLRAQLAGFTRRTRCLGSHFTHPARVSLTTTPGGVAHIEVFGKDRPALLFDLAWVLAREKISVRSAIIDTAGWSVQDAFEVVADPSTEPGVWERLPALLVEALENPSAPR